MTFDIINGLIEKYFAGETSLEDEKILRGYFNSAHVDERLHTYALLFKFFEKEKTIVLEDSKMPKSEITRPKFQILLRYEIPTLSGRGGQFWKIAATVAFLVVGSITVFKVFKQEPIGILTQTPKHKGAKMIILDDDSDPKVALQKVNEALALVSKKMKKGTDETTDGLLKLRDATEILHKDN